jgi:hypothetical protein
MRKRVRYLDHPPGRQTHSQSSGARQRFGYTREQIEELLRGGLGIRRVVRISASGNGVVQRIKAELNAGTR